MPHGTPACTASPGTRPAQRKMSRRMSTHLAQPDDQQRRHVTTLLVQWSDGDDAAMQELLPLVYDELRRLARGQMSREREDHVLQATALVNEAFLRLVDVHQIQWRNRTHFFAMAARLMRRILVEYARARLSEARWRGTACHIRRESDTAGGHGARSRRSRRRVEGACRCSRAEGPGSGTTTFRWAVGRRDGWRSGRLGGDGDAGLEVCQELAPARAVASIETASVT